jgi:hypothetical protein
LVIPCASGLVEGASNQHRCQFSPRVVSATSSSFTISQIMTLFGRTRRTVNGLPAPTVLAVPRLRR